MFNNFWPDGDNIVMDDVFLPAADLVESRAVPASEWNEVDTTDNSHPFRISSRPSSASAPTTADNTMGFLGEAGLNSEYGLSYASARSPGPCAGAARRPIRRVRRHARSALPWSPRPDPDEFFQSTVLHEAGHFSGLDHYNNYLSMQNASGNVDKILRGETLYMDDKEGVRQHATHVTEYDMVMYNKYHNGSVPLWMTSSPTTARVGQTINFNNITVENRGTFATGDLRFGIYLSTNSFISTGDQLLNTGIDGSFGRFTFEHVQLERDGSLRERLRHAISAGSSTTSTTIRSATRAITPSRSQRLPRTRSRSASSWSGTGSSRTTRSEQPG